MRCLGASCAELCRYLMVVGWRGRSAGLHRVVLTLGGCGMAGWEHRSSCLRSDQVLLLLLLLALLLLLPAAWDSRGGIQWGKRSGQPGTSFNKHSRYRCQPQEGTTRRMESRQTGASASMYSMTHKQRSVLFSCSPAQGVEGHVGSLLAGDEHGAKAAVGGIGRDKRV